MDRKQDGERGHERPRLREASVTQLWRWCVAVTLRDARRARRRGRWVSRPNLERVATRRWWRVSEGAEERVRQKLTDEARLAIRRAWTSAKPIPQGER